MKLFTSDRLVSQVTEKGSLATGDFEDQEILNLAYDCLLSEMVPFIVSLREDYLVRTKDYPVTAGQAAYAIPSRSVGMTLHDIKIVRGQSVVPVFQMSRQDITSTSQGTPKAFYKEENSVVLYPTPDRTEDTLRLTYFIRPPALVPVAECGRIATIDTNTITITGTFPASWTTSNTFDIVNGTSGYEYRGTDLTALAVTTSSITLSSLPSSLAIGDYIGLAEESCFPQIPQELHQLLVQMTLAACLEAKGDREGLAIAQARTQAMMAALRTMLQDRVEGRPQRLRTRLL